jgi:hypothetical protein
MIRSLADLVEKGSTIESACNLCEISDSSFKNWREQGESGVEPYLTFLTAIKKAQGERTRRRINRIAECGEDRISADGKVTKGDWQALAWLEERQNQAQYGRNVTKFRLNKQIMENESLSQIDKLLALNEEILKKMSDGELSAEAANLACNVIEQLRKTHETAEFSKKLAEIEERIK